MIPSPSRSIRGAFARSLLLRRTSRFARGTETIRTWNVDHYAAIDSFPVLFLNNNDDDHSPIQRRPQQQYQIDDHDDGGGPLARSLALGRSTRLSLGRPGHSLDDGNGQWDFERHDELVLGTVNTSSSWPAFSSTASLSQRYLHVVDTIELRGQTNRIEELESTAR
jgi:hypothetical protein